MTKDELNLPDEFFDQFKSQADLENFLSKIFKQGVNQLLKAEMNEHLGYKKYEPKGRNSGNSRNGTSDKTIKTSYGQIPIEVPRDRNGDFSPELIPKHQRMSEKIEQAVIGMYSRGMSTSDIEDQIKEIYGVNLDQGTVSNITNTLLEHIKEWQSRPLEDVYYIVWMDGISIKIRHNGKVINKTIYLVIGLDKNGMKDVLGMWINETESASFWLHVLTDLKARGVEDILIASTDNLSGLTKAINSTFPDAVTQLCVVHQIRNSSRYVVWKDKKEFMADLKRVYGAPTLESAEEGLERFEQKWTGKYAYAVKSWKENWGELTHYFDYPIEIRKIIYTTNIIENLNRNIRKYIKTKSLFPDDNAAKKAVFLSISNVQNKWTQPIRNWGVILNQFLIKFEDRCRL
jgi:transposase-like protein